MIKVRLESFNGNVSVIELPNRNLVNEFLNEFAKRIEKNVSLKVAIDQIGFSAILRGEK